MSTVAVCDEGFSLTMWTTVFRVNSQIGKEARVCCFVFQAIDALTLV